MTTPAVAIPPILPQGRENPFPWYRQMLDTQSVLYFEPMRIWNVFGYEECVTVLKDAATWSSAGRLEQLPPEQRPAPSMLNSDPPDHSRLRGLVNTAFTPRRVTELRPRIEQIARDLLEPKVPAGKVDLVLDLAYPLPVIVIAEMLGVPPEDRDRFKHWSDEIIATLGFNLTETEPPNVQPVIDEMFEYFRGVAEQRRKQPKDDLMSALVAAEVAGDRLTTEELLQMCLLLLVAGNETTTNLIGNAVQEFMAHPEELAKLRARPELLPSAIEEVLRFSSPVQATGRVSMKATTVGGHEIEEGKFAVVWLQAANRDGTVFPDPDRFDIERTPNRHLAFGLGIHFCLGAPLARLEAEVALARWLAMTKDFARADDAVLERVPTFIMRGVRSLPLDVVPA
jgi:cytochrome P450